jgi:glycosyltransferase involved in cell wall biosynthesis
MASHTLLSALAACVGTFDVLHFQSVDPALFAPLVSWRTRIVATSHGQAYRRGKWGPLGRWASRQAERVFMTVPDGRIAVSRTLKRYYETRYRRPVTYIPSGVDVHPPVPGHATLDRYGLAPRDYLLFAGRLDPSKGCHLAIEAFLRSDVPHKLVVLGDSTYTRQYVEMLHACGSSRVVFLGHQSGLAFWEILQNCLAFVFPSEMEGLSVVLLEALGQALPVIYSEIPENEEVAAGVGFGFRPGNAHDLTDVMRYVVDHPAEARARGIRGRERILRDFTWDLVAARTEQVYRSVLEDAETGGRQASVA